MAAPAIDRDLKRIEEMTGGRLGVASIKIGSPGGLFHRAHDSFAMCSTFKAPLAAAVLDAKSRISLDTVVPFTAADLQEYAPAARRNLDHGSMTVAELCAAAVQESDNTAANLLLNLIGGPPAVTAFFRKIGDTRTRLDRMEPALNMVKPGDPRDTTTPKAMLASLEKMTFGDALPADDRLQLRQWMQGATTGLKRLRAGFPSDWIVGDKTGTSDRVSGDLAFAEKPDGQKIIAVVYVDAPKAPGPVRETAIAEIGKLIAARL